MDMNIKWTEFSMEAEVDAYGLSRLCLAHNSACAERDRLAIVNAELLAALGWIEKSLTLAGDPELACQQYQLDIARAAIAKSEETAK